MHIMECEWCGMLNPEGGWDYYYIKVYYKEHLICSDCYRHLFNIRYEKDKQDYSDFVEKLKWARR